MQEMPKPSAKDDPRSIANAPLAALGLGALGVVFGDIGTSPLYTLKTVLDFTGPHPDAATIMGALSLILWTLFIIERRQPPPPRRHSGHAQRHGC